MKTLITLIIASLFLASCQKQPVASFTTDKTEYYAGDTIHLTNTSEHGHIYIWTMPDGSKQTTENAYYVVDTSVQYEKLTFQLEADSKHERKKAFALKQVLAVVKPKLGINTYSFGNTVLNSIEPILYANKNPFLISIADYGYNQGNLNFYSIVDTSFSNLSGVYTLQQNKGYVMGKTAYAQLSYFCYDCFPIGVTDYTYTTISGNMIIGNLNGKPHVIINDATAVSNNTGQITKISVNIIVNKTIR